jgi:hypothetical protein
MIGNTIYCASMGSFAITRSPPCWTVPLGTVMSRMANSTLQTANLTSYYRPFIAEPSSPPRLWALGDNDGDTSI